jgi:hypothetical protein
MSHVGLHHYRNIQTRLNTVSRTTTRTQTNNAVPSFQAAIRPRNIAGFGGVIRGGGARVPQNVHNHSLICVHML